MDKNPIEFLNTQTEKKNAAQLKNNAEVFAMKDSLQDGQTALKKRRRKKQSPF